MLVVSKDQVDLNSNPHTLRIARMKIMEQYCSLNVYPLRSTGLKKKMFSMLSFLFFFFFLIFYRTI